ncbi:hypothetical protein C2G38_2056401 [Gigaspora rosea]|uniref:Uncharacterized protein n=1 Tax=Gigaspora rosea TaxID=44941 RepID=A0A397W6C7_9GLOM|nr:hypothetical protein C2G38_2056401 [Gigaspora rosea]
MASILKLLVTFDPILLFISFLLIIVITLFFLLLTQVFLIIVGIASFIAFLHQLIFISSSFSVHLLILVLQGGYGFQNTFYVLKCKKKIFKKYDW